MASHDHIRNKDIEILIAEDSPTQAEQLKYLLEEQGYAVTVAAHGKQALETARRRKPTLIISDIVMPEMDGYALCRAVKTDQELKDIPVMMVTALSSIQDIAMGLECGADNFIRKPYEPKSLLGRIDYILLNRDLRKSRKMQPGLEIYLAGKKHLITSEREQILDLLVSSYEQAVQMNEELKLREWEISTLNADLQRRARELEAANKELESFSYSVSHDLRAPLRAIDGFAKILEQDYNHKLDNEGRRLLGVVSENARRMGQLIEDLLQFSRMARQSMATVEIDMTALAREAFDELQGAGGRPPKCLLEPLPAARGDRSLIRQIWINLLSNAIKYCGLAKDPLIQVTGHSEGTENVYCVKDNGAGFDMQYYNKLFGVFQRLHSADQFPGTGVGLAIVQRVVARHGGRVWAEGKVNEGASFYFALPGTKTRF
jgi:signal transduction histidine kinase